MVVIVKVEQAKQLEPRAGINQREAEFHGPAFFSRRTTEEGSELKSLRPFPQAILRYTSRPPQRRRYPRISKWRRRRIAENGAQPNARRRLMGEGPDWAMTR